MKAVKKWLGAVLLTAALGVAGGAAGAWTAGCSSPPKKAKKTQPRVEKKKPQAKDKDDKDKAVKPKHLPHEHAHPHPHGESDHHHHSHPHPHLPGQNGHHHPY